MDLTSEMNGISRQTLDIDHNQAGCMNKIDQKNGYELSVFIFLYDTLDREYLDNISKF